MTRLKTYFLATLLTLIVFVAVIGVGASMPIEKDGAMHCLFSGTSLCQMSGGEHVNKWQGLFQTIIQSPFTVLLSLVWVGLTVVLLPSKFDLALLLHRIWPKGRDPDVNLFDYLLHAFSQGILHSQIYA